MIWLTRRSRVTHTLVPYTALLRSPVRGPRRRHHRRLSRRLARRRRRRLRGDGGCDDRAWRASRRHPRGDRAVHRLRILRSEEHTSELQSLMRISYAVFCMKKKKKYYVAPQSYTKTVHHNPTL